MSSDRGKLVIISSPSGAGKTTLARRLLGEFSERMEFSVSYTTRKPRKNETDGVDYCFVDSAEFERMIEAGEFAEWAEVHGNRYGTSRSAVDRALSGGRDVVFDVDWQGGRALSDKWPADSVKVFILPPDLDTLESRLRRRATDAEDVIQRRLRKAIDELTHYDEYAHLVVNDDLERAYDALRAIYLVSRFGAAPRDDVAHDLPALAAMVEGQRRAGLEDHARGLITAGQQRSERGTENPAPVS